MPEKPFRIQLVVSPIGDQGETLSVNVKDEDWKLIRFFCGEHE